MHRRLIATLVGMLAALAVAGAVAAGGWATIAPDAAVGPVAGQPTDIGFTVLQHGVTPTSAVTPSVVVSDVATGASVSFPATRAGKTGHFVATVSASSTGPHTWVVTLPELAVEMNPISFVVSANPVAAQAGPSVGNDSEIAAGTEVARLRDELTVMRVAVVGMAAALAGVLAGGATIALSRRRPSPARGDPAPEVA